MAWTPSCSLRLELWRLWCPLSGPTDTEVFPSLCAQMSAEPWGAGPGFPRNCLESSSAAQIFRRVLISWGFPGGASGNEPACQCRRRDVDSIPGSERSPGGGHGNPLQYSCLENPVDIGVWQATSPQGRKELDMTKETQHAQTHVNFL